MHRPLFVVLVCLLCLATPGLVDARLYTSEYYSNPITWIAATRQLVTRLIPSHANQFQFIPLNATVNNRSGLPGLSNDQFVVRASAGTVTVYGTSGVSLASGVYWYLKEVVKCQVTWGVNGTGDQLQLPPVLPDVDSTEVNASVPIRYAWNMCTFSYSGVWWDEVRWQREIDWMALHGVNFPLALTGQEYTWLKVFERYNVSLDLLESWFSGPAFLAWQRAGNIRGFAGPLSYHWIKGQADLQQFILHNMRSLGMTPIQTCFAGHVPQIARQIWPNATFTPSAAWNNFAPNETDVWYLDPTDPLFPELGATFMEVQIELFGASQYYNCDTFNEVDPKSTSHTYLAAASAAVHNAIVQADPTGIWVMQAWLFHSGFWKNSQLVQAYLSGVQNDKMLILDLNSEAGVLAVQYDQYYGKPWVWNMLHNYGGVRGVYGNLTCIATSPYENLHAVNSTMVGMGFTPEAIEQNPVMYEMLTQNFWASGPIDVQRWLFNYVVQRYGPSVTTESEVWQAWQQLFNAVYNQPGEPRSEIEWVPHWQTSSFGWQNGNATGMFQAFETFLAAAQVIPNATSNGPFQYDFVDVTRQAATMFFSDVHRCLENEGWQMYQSNVTTSLQALSDKMLDLIQTIDQLLGTNPNYLLGLWTKGATDWALPNETDLYLYNAKNQITMWGPAAQIDDYAAKAWNGLYGTYYYARWKILLDQLVATANSTNPNWNSYQYETNAFNIEVEWCENASQVFPTVPDSSVSPIALAARLHEAIHLPQAQLLEQYNATPNMNAFGNDYPIMPMWTKDPRQLALLCNMMEDCFGFTSMGYLKHGTLRPTPYSGSTLYVKHSYLAKQSQANEESQPAPSSAAPKRKTKFANRKGKSNTNDKNSKLYGN